MFNIYNNDLPPPLSIISKVNMYSLLKLYYSKGTIVTFTLYSYLSNIFSNNYNKLLFQLSELSKQVNYLFKNNAGNRPHLYELGLNP